MEDWSFGYATQEKRLVARFPCNWAGLSVRCTLPLVAPEPPWKSSNLSPEPSPNGARSRGPRWGSASVAWEPVRVSVVCSGGCLIGRPRLPLRADGVGEAGTPAVVRARSEEHTSELQSRENLVCRLLLEKK